MLKTLKQERNKYIKIYLLICLQEIAHLEGYEFKGR